LAKTVVLVTGAGGQIGTVLVDALRKLHGTDNVIASDLKLLPSDGPFEIIDVTSAARIAEVTKKYKVTQIYHLAALLSSSGEANIDLTWKINFNSYLSILALAQEQGISKVFFPSSIGIYGPTTPKVMTPQNASFIPSTIYGMSKITGELWGEYYRNRYGLDVRSLRYPGVISYEVIPEGGTTDFAVEIFFDAKRKGHYVSYLKKDTRLPMIYMPDVITSTLQLMTAEKEDVSTAMGYNIASFSLTPEEAYAEIKKHLPDFTIEYQPDARQKIADSWTETTDDSLARTDWGWQPTFDMPAMAIDMLKNIKIA